MRCAAARPRDTPEVPRPRQPGRRARRLGAERAGHRQAGHRVGGRTVARTGAGGVALMRVLVVEDEAALADAVARGLRREGMAVDVAYDGDSGHEKASVTRYDVVVLDRDLPGMGGDDLCAEIVSSGSTTRVLMLTASGTLADKVDGLSRGADDYLAKPFDFPELVARCRALGRRAPPPPPPPPAAPPPRGAAVARGRRRRRGSRPSHREPGRAVARPHPQGVRGAGGAARGAGCRGE